ncbi:MAG: hypothetical protein WBC22_15365 [Sedimentisphaerales bacterium]
MKLKKRYRQWRAKRKRIQAAIKVAKMGMGGQPLNVLHKVPTAGKSSRNLARLKTCERVMAELKAEGKKDTDLYRGWEEEYKRRMVRFQQSDITKE